MLTDLVLPSSGLSSPTLWRALLTGAPLMCTALAAVVAPRTARAGRWRVARWATGLSLGAAGIGAAALALYGAGHGHGVRWDPVTSALQLLIGFLGFVIVRFSASYLAGEPREAHYVRWLLWTLTAVGVVISSNHLAVLAAAWLVTSLTLHPLLTFYADRPGALAAAHKKFWMARAADLCMCAALVLIVATDGTLAIDQLVGASAANEMPLPMTAAIVLIAFATLLRGAVMPFHGWILSVMEAPTPVSALLHAGVVNIGGLVLLRLAPLVSATPFAQGLLVIFGCMSAVIAALVMSTQSSVKVRLAWSTCAQLGLMFVECGLGAWGLALLHLVAHSLYKAYAFLSAGETVHVTMVHRLTSAGPAEGAASHSVQHRLVHGSAAVVLACCAMLCADAVWTSIAPEPRAARDWLLAGVVTASLVTFVLPGARDGMRGVARRVATVLLLSAAYLGLHRVVNSAIEAQTPPAPVAAIVFAIAGFLSLFVVRALLVVHPHGAFARRLRPWLRHGLFLDDLMSRGLHRLFTSPTPAPVPTLSRAHGVEFAARGAMAVSAVRGVA